MNKPPISVPTESHSTMFIKNAIPIEAAQFLEGQSIPKGICFGGKCSNNYVMDGVTEKQPHVHTAHGNQRVFIEFGDWIVPEADGHHYYPIKPDVFAKTYRPAASSSLLPVGRQLEPKWERQESCPECDGDGCPACCKNCEKLASLPVGESTRVWVLGKYENGDDITHGVTADKEKAMAWETGAVDQYAQSFDLCL